MWSRFLESTDGTLGHIRPSLLFNYNSSPGNQFQKSNLKRSPQCGTPKVLEERSPGVLEFWNRRVEFEGPRLQEA